jgi:hypothetical protein
MVAATSAAMKRRASVISLELPKAEPACVHDDGSHGCKHKDQGAECAKPEAQHCHGCRDADYADRERSSLGSLRGNRIGHVVEPLPDGGAVLPPVVAADEDNSQKDKLGH